MSQTVLLVDDEASILDILATWLDDAGYRTCIATNGYDGLVKINDINPDLVVTDILMPQMNGLELCYMVREMTTAPIMFLTGLGRELDKNASLRAGGNDFLTKPVSMSVFLAHVDWLMKRGASHNLFPLDILRQSL